MPTSRAGRAVEAAHYTVAALALIWRELPQIAEPQQALRSLDRRIAKLPKLIKRIEQEVARLERIAGSNTAPAEGDCRGRRRGGDTTTVAG